VANAPDIAGQWFSWARSSAVTVPHIVISSGFHFSFVALSGHIGHIWKWWIYGYTRIAITEETCDKHVKNYGILG
jgi:hypothetical protein